MQTSLVLLMSPELETLDVGGTSSMSPLLVMIVAEEIDAAQIVARTGLKAHRLKRQGIKQCLPREFCE